LSETVKRLRRRAAISADGELERLYEELKGYPGVHRQAPLTDTLEHDIVLPLRLAHPRGELTFLSTVSTFGTANDVTLAELAIEAFYPANAKTATTLLRS
jgi:MmyB-like transcription regulator ligand binding domain